MFILKCLCEDWPAWDRFWYSVYPEWVKHENRCSQLRIQEAFCCFSWNGTIISEMVLAMEGSWDLVLMSEGTKAGRGKVLPHPSPARSGDEPWLCGDCTHWTWGTFANSDNQIVLETTQHKLSAASGGTFKWLHTGKTLLNHLLLCFD